MTQTTPPATTPATHTPNEVLTALRQLVSEDSALRDQLLTNPSPESVTTLLQAALRAAGRDYPASAIAACLHAPGVGAGVATAGALSDQTLDAVAGGRGGQQNTPWGPPLVPVIYSVALCPEAQKGEPDPYAVITL